jgi:transcription-repair coupling factor (superfamily II helicase)
MLEDAVAEISGTAPTVFAPPRLELPGEAYLPESFIPIASLRLDFYRRAVESRSLEEIGDLFQELRDRFGPLPREATTLIDASAIRIVGAELGLESVVVKANVLSGRRYPDQELSRPEWESLMERLGEGARFGGEAPLRFEVPLAGESPPEQIRAARNRLLSKAQAEYFGSLISAQNPGVTTSDVDT